MKMNYQAWRINVKGFLDTDLARRAGKVGKKNSPWNTSASCSTQKAALSNMKYRQGQKLKEDKKANT
jgi:hypothetical protein